jgi:hypothetical protein
MNSFAIASAHPKNSRTITGVDGAHRGGPALTLGIDTYRTVAGGRNTRPRFALAENTGETVAFANPMDSFAVAFAHTEHSWTIPRVNAPHRSRPALSLSIDTYRAGAGAGNTGPGCALTKNTGKAAASALSDDSIGWSNPKNASTAITQLGSLNGGDLWITRISNYIRHGYLFSKLG